MSAAPADPARRGVGWGAMKQLLERTGNDARSSENIVS
jgi:hypothetical protein